MEYTGKSEVIVLRYNAVNSSLLEQIEKSTILHYRLFIETYQISSFDLYSVKRCRRKKSACLLNAYGVWPHACLPPGINRNS